MSDPIGECVGIVGLSALGIATAGMVAFATNLHSLGAFAIALSIFVGVFGMLAVCGIVRPLTMAGENHE